MIEQCPSTRAGKSADPKPGRAALAARERPLAELAGRPVWRSLEEIADTTEFREFVEREFPAGASELLRDSRREFLKLMGASMALAGAATLPGCRRPDHKIMPYGSEVPEEVIPGRPLFYATSMPVPGGGAEGVLVETHEGRPTKIEGNPLHPVNRGRSTVWSQASIVSLYDPDRLAYSVRREGGHETVAQRLWGREEFEKFDATRGRGLAFIVNRDSSPTRGALRRRVLERWPEATWLAYDPVGSAWPAEGARIALGAPMRPVPRLDRAKVIVSLDADFLGHGPEQLVHARDFASTRRVEHAGDPMSRLYVVESAYTITGAAADHRFAVAPSRIAAFALALGRALAYRIKDGLGAVHEALAAIEIPPGPDVDEGLIGKIVADLVEDESHRARRGETLIVAGPTQPPAVHALVALLNEALGNAGRTVSYRAMSEEEASDSLEGLGALAGRMRAGEIETLVCVHVNPVYDAPAALEFGGLYRSVPTTICLSVDANETAAASTWSVHGSHDLERWGDTRAIDGTVAPVQPMIAPIFGGVSDIELLAYVLGEDDPKGYEIVRAAWRTFAGEWLPGREVDFERFWRRALHEGVVTGTAEEPKAPAVRQGEVVSALRATGAQRRPADDALDVLFTTGHLYDGRFANVGWLQELPADATRVVWDNPALMSPATAERLGVSPGRDPYIREREPQARVATIAVDGREMRLPVWLMPGLPENTVVLTLGYGREVCGRVGGDAASPVGFNTYRLRDAAGSRVLRGASVRRTNGEYPISSTQNHWTLESRTSIVRAADRKHFDAHAGRGLTDRPSVYGEVSRLTLAEQMGEMSHTPPNVSLYTPPYAGSPRGPDPDARDAQGEPPRFTRRPQWGMSIDLATCVGCGACTVACQAENNIPIVGKKEVAKGREMTWIRVDRYYTGADLEHPDEMLHQPVACVHCENAPCETVCPVNATVHGPEGLNYMVYNRCIGTRYCANNCPYKVRRFNFFDYGVAKYRGDYAGQGVFPQAGRRNVNLVPPRLRQKLDEISKLQMNPDVTVRSRGVMEKCTYCIQRINAARAECRISDIRGPGGEWIVPDGFFQTACEQACPTGSIVFGDILDPESRVANVRDTDRAYLLLGFLNTRPRTTYRMRIRNPNPAIRVYDLHDPFEHGAGDGEGGGGHALAQPVRERRARGREVRLPVLAQAGVRA
jgi:MoCo/4Fe-4S cofactor protein with predicted Tat translocation signal